MSGGSRNQAGFGGSHLHHDLSLTRQEERPEAQTSRSDGGKQECFETGMSDRASG